MGRRTTDPRMRTQLVAPFLARVRAAGGDPAAIAQRFGLPASAETDPEVVLPLSALHELFDAVEAATGDPFVGLHVGADLPRGTYGLLEFSSRSAPTVREALARVVRYMGLLNEVVEVTLVEDAHEGVLTQRIPGAALCVGRHGNEGFLAMVLCEARRLSGAPWVPRRAWLAHPRPRDVSELIALVGTPEVAFGAEANGFALPTAVLDLPLASSDPPLLSLLDRQAIAALAARAGPNRFLGDVRERIREQLADAGPSLESVAAALKLSRRTLQRRLADDGVSFQALVEAVRRELAQLFVEEGSRPLGEVAFLLGYAELSAFFRAFKRWTGMTPSEYRSRR
ncbi:MAG: AraC family transcriptional regulator [Myxococcota bacterium]|nr:AraC family transcriptional regulator [Myxococcota bacterium]